MFDQGQNTIRNCIDGSFETGGEQQNAECDDFLVRKLVLVVCREELREDVVRIARDLPTFRDFVAQICDEVTPRTLDLLGGIAIQPAGQGRDDPLRPLA